MSGLFGELSGGGGAGEDWERIVAVQDRSSGLRAIIVLHSLRRGPAFGGVRRFAYADEAAALADAKRLAHAMSLKCALAELPAGGAKTVILDHGGLAREAAYEALGRAIDALGGDYVCGPDIGTGEAELAALRRGTRWVNPADNDAGRSTAAGVLAGLRGLAEVVFEDGDIGAHSYVIQGLGAVGSALASALIGVGAAVAGWDPDPAARERAAKLGVRLLDEAALLCEPCDVFMPCALGGVLSSQVCEAAPWKAVCGSANNQLADAGAAEVLRRRGITWAPDFLVNVGAVLEGVETVVGEEDDVRARVVQGIEAIRGRCARVLVEARELDRSPLEVALAAARAALEAGQPSQVPRTGL
jgi:glutamate dehydrogenase/leucine dehydrogenase